MNDSIILLEAATEWGLNTYADEMEASPDVQDWAVLREKAAESVRALQFAISAIDKAIIEVLPAGGMYIPSIARTVMPSAKPGKVKTEGKKLALLLAARVADTPGDPETGETLPLGVLCAKVADELIQCSGIGTESHRWRTTALKERGVEIKDYSDVGEWTTELRFLDQ